MTHTRRDSRGQTKSGPAPSLRDHGRANLAICLVIAAGGLWLWWIAVTPANGQPWWPAFEKGGGSYCASDLKIPGDGRRGARAPRTGSIIVRDYERPLRRLPATKRPARSGQLPFGPASVTIRPTRRDYGNRLRVGGGTFGYALVNHRRRSAVRLGWMVTGKMVMLNRRGRASRVVGTVRQSIRAIAAGKKRKVALQTSDVPGLYRFDLVLRSRGAQHRVAYSDYVRVLVPVLHVRLGSRSKSYRGGEVVYARVENLGTKLVHDLREYSVERFTEEGWERVGPHALGWPRSPAPLLSAGKARCQDFRVPSHASPGRYRLVKYIGYGSVTGRTMLALTREFRVR